MPKVKIFHLNKILPKKNFIFEEKQNSVKRENFFTENLANQNSDKENFANKTSAKGNPDLNFVKENLANEKAAFEYPPEKIEKKESLPQPTCLICFDRDSDAVIMDCGHGGLFLINCENDIYISFNIIGICYTCCIELWKKGQDCYLCRKV